MVRIYKSPGHKTYILYPVLPALVEDVNCLMKDWGNEGRIDPFKELYDVSQKLGSILIKSLIPRREACFSNDGTLGDMPGTS